MFENFSPLSESVSVQRNVWKLSTSDGLTVSVQRPEASGPV